MGLEFKTLKISPLTKEDLEGDIGRACSHLLLSSYGKRFSEEAGRRFPTILGVFDRTVYRMRDVLWKSYAKKYREECKQKGLPVLT
jgi:hypothetical protein